LNRITFSCRKQELFPVLRLFREFCGKDCISFELIFSSLTFLLIRNLSFLFGRIPGALHSLETTDSVRE
jgi:hypothetical protein